MNVDDLIEIFNDGHDSFLKHFGDSALNFLRFVNRRGKIDKLDENNLEENYPNEFLLFLHDTDKEKFWKEVLNKLNDVEMVNGKPMLILADRGDLSALFCDGNRNALSRDTIEALLNGDYDSHSYGWNSYDLTDDVYRDVVQELTKENILHLKEYIIKTLEGKSVEPHTELLKEYAEKQGHPEYVVIDQSNIDQVVDDEKTMKELLDNELDELKGELYSIYGSAYNNAYEEELYEETWGALGEFFDTDNGQWISRPHTYKKDTEVHFFTLPIRDFEKFVLDYLTSNMNRGRWGTLDYHGSYLDTLKDETECLSVYPSDYPDSRLIDKNINLYFSDYI